MGREIATTLMIASSNFSFVVLAAQIPERTEFLFPTTEKTPPIFKNEEKKHIEWEEAYSETPDEFQTLSRY